MNGPTGADMNLFDAIAGQLATADFAFVGRLDEPDDSEVEMISDLQLLAQAVERAKTLEPQLIHDPAFKVLFEQDWKELA